MSSLTDRGCRPLSWLTLLTQAPHNVAPKGGYYDASESRQAVPAWLLPRFAIPHCIYAARERELIKLSCVVVSEHLGAPCAKLSAPETRILHSRGYVVSGCEVSQLALLPHTCLTF